MSDTMEDMSENKARMLRGELYFAFTPELLKERRRCAIAVREYNTADISSRRIQVQLLRNILGDETPMPAVAADEEADAALFDDDPWVEPPCRFDYGTNVKLGRNVYLNNNVVFIDTCLTTVGARTMFAPNVSVFSGGHPLDPAVRNGTKGPEFGKEIHIGEDCWIGGNVTIVPGVNIGNGAVVGAGSVVTKDVAPFTVVVGNPARKVKDVPRGTDEARTSGALDALQRDIMRTMH